MPDRYVLVLAGGRGERFWPWSRPERPKQLLPLASGGRTLLAATFERALRVVQAPERVIVMTAMDLRSACQEACPGATVLGEPVARNTAPAIAAAAAGYVPSDSAFAVMPADHAIDDVDAFVSDLELAFQVVEREPMLATFGIRPSGPDTNFGYVRRGAKLRDRVYRAAHFTEKPDRAKAEEYVKSGEYGWNSGIFVWRRARSSSTRSKRRSPSSRRRFVTFRMAAPRRTSSSGSSRRFRHSSPCRSTTRCSSMRRTSW
jgi:mannose-1-phosphate guanylyltransferase